MFAFFFAIRKNTFRSSPKIKLSHFFHRNNLLHHRNYIQNTWFEGENAIDNLVGNASSGSLIIVDSL